jgi:serine/threonine protein phosphatase 1
MNTLVIGDIHGCFYELQALLDKAGLTSGDKIVAVGDIVDRGPETPEVLDFFQNTPHAQALMGNHERKHVQGSRGEIQLAVSQLISRNQLAEAYPAAVTWMSSLQLFLDLPEAIIVHGFLEPGIPLSEQNPSIICGTMGGERILRDHYERPWYELYAGDRPVIVGHLNYADSDQPFFYQDRVFGLDTSCVMGKSLTGLLLPSFKIVSVPSRGNLWKSVRQEFRATKKQGETQPTEAWSDINNIALIELIEKVEVVSEVIIAKLRFSRRYNKLKPRQQAKMYAEVVGEGPRAILLQMARVGKLDLEAARKIVRKVELISNITRQIDSFIP